MSLPRIDLWRTAAGCFCVGIATLLAGCSSDETASNNPGFEVAGEGDDTPSGSGSQAQGSSAGPATAGTNQMATGGNQPVAHQEPIGQPPSDPGLTLDGYKSPDGNAAELLTFMQNIDNRMPQGESRQERLADMIQMQRAIIEAADKLMKLDNVNDDQAVEAAHRKITAYATLDQFEVEGVREDVEAYLTALAASNNPRLVELAKLVSTSRLAVELIDGKTDDPTVVVNRLKQVVAELEASETVFAVAFGIANQLDSAGFEEAADQAFQAVQAKFANSDNERIQGALSQIALEARLEELQFNEKLQSLMAEEDNSVAPFMMAIDELLRSQPPTPTLFNVARQSSGILESSAHYEESLQILKWTQAAFANSQNERLKEQANNSVALAEKRLTLIGKQLPLAGMVALDGKPFDWNAYRGRIVLVDFWASWCGPCLAEFPEMREHYKHYNDKGFEILGVNLDDTAEAAKDFLNQQPLPWRTVVSTDPESMGFDNPAAAFSGVESIPFMVLLDQDGVVRELHVRGAKLEQRLQEIFGPVEPAPGQPAPAQPNPAAGQPPAGGQPAPNGTSSLIRPRAVANSFVFFFDDPPGELAPAQAAAPTGEESAKPAKEEPRKFAEIRGIEIDNSINPYAPDPGMSKLELAQFILDMRDKPKSIQRRPGFAEGMLAGCDQLIEATGGKGRFYEIAVLEKLATLHRAASFGDADADKQLNEFVDSLGKPDREKIALEVAFHKIERRLIEVAESESTEVDDLLSELADYYAEAELSEKHLRMASNTVKAINKIDDGEAREKHFQEFGKLFAASGDKELSRYGKRIAKVEGSGTSDLVGKPVELAGITADGLPLDWNTYRGKVVIVDFWATWCGPCRREMPKLQATYEEHRNKGLEVVGVSLDQDLEALAEYLAEQNIAWPTLAGADAEELGTKYNVRGIPTMLLVDKEGSCVAAGHNVAALMPKAMELLNTDK